MAIEVYNSAQTIVKARQELEPTEFTEVVDSDPNTVRQPINQPPHLAPTESHSKQIPEDAKDNRLKLYQSQSAIIVRLLALTTIFLLVWFLKFIAVDAVANILNLGTTGVVSLSIFLSFLVGAVFAILAVALVIAWRRTSYEINNEEIVLKNGSKIIRKTFETAAASIGLITVDQGPIAKKLNYGKVFLSGAKGPKGEEIMLHNVDDPYGVKALIEKVIGRTEKPEVANIP